MEEKINIESEKDIRKEEIIIDKKVKKDDNLIIKSTENIKEETKVEQCKVLYINNKGIAVDFKGYGIQILASNEIKDKIKNSNRMKIFVQYTSDIGKNDFKYWVEE